MSHQTRRAFVLRSVPYGENRRILDLLTKEGEILTLSCHKTGKMGPANVLSQPFILADFELFYYKYRYSLNGGQMVYPFAGLQADFDRMTALAHLAEVYLDALKSQVAQPQAYDLWAYTASRIEQSSQPLLDVRISQFKFLCLLGFMPWLFDCVTCHRAYEPSMVFNFHLSGLECRYLHAGPGDRPSHSLAMSPGLWSALRYIVQADVPSLFNFQASPELQAELQTFSDAYLEQIMEKNYTRLRLSQEAEAFSQRLAQARQKPGQNPQSADLPKL
ncbi:MAG: DNA repair protein RecO [Eubacteriales bacterium]|nr:DNA repair protein RecO [Clostridiales bacterium]MDY5836838.1 DNA repair protein RecO [Eubacteriales bacterium]